MKIMGCDQKLQNLRVPALLPSAPQVAVNGGHVLDFKHRLELQRVDTLYISGKIRVEAVGVLPPSSVSPALLVVLFFT